MKPTNRANQRTMGTQTMFETYPEVKQLEIPESCFAQERPAEQSFVKDSALGNRYEHVKAENENYAKNSKSKRRFCTKSSKCN